MTTSRNLNRNLKLNPMNELNGVMEQNPSNKTELESEIRLGASFFKINKLLTLLILTLWYSISFSQVKVNSLGYVGLGTNSADPYYKVLVKGDLYVEALNTQDWGRAVWTKVSKNLACSYHLWNTVYGSDVFYVRGDGYSWALKQHISGSDIRFKENITPIENSLNRILKLQGVRFQYKGGSGENGTESSEEEDFHIGFIAQEVETVFPELIKTMHDGTKAMAYANLTAALVEAIKEQQRLIENLQQESHQERVLLRQEIEDLREALNKCCNTSPQKSMIIENENNTEQNFIVPTGNNAEEMKVYQNRPNPFNEITTIQCYVPQSMQNVQLCVYDMTGTLLKCLAVTERGNIDMQIQAGQLATGIYIYLLIGDGKTSEAKQMIITK